MPYSHAQSRKSAIAAPSTVPTYVCCFAHLSWSMWSLAVTAASFSQCSLVVSADPAPSHRGRTAPRGNRSATYSKVYSRATPPPVGASERMTTPLWHVWKSSLSARVWPI